MEQKKYNKLANDTVQKLANIQSIQHISKDDDFRPDYKRRIENIRAFLVENFPQYQDQLQNMGLGESILPDKLVHNVAQKMPSPDVMAKLSEQV